MTLMSHENINISLIYSCKLGESYTQQDSLPLSLCPEMNRFFTLKPVLDKFGLELVVAIEIEHGVLLSILIYCIPYFL